MNLSNSLFRNNMLLKLFSVLFLSFHINLFSEEHLYPPKCLTFDESTKKEILIRHILNHPNLDLQTKHNTLQHLKDGTSIVRFELTHSHLSPTGRFRIHYDLDGENAVDATDLNGNGIPDYIDSVAKFFDWAFEVQVNQIGYLPPPKDFGEGGGTEYDIYILELGKNRGGYGYTNAENEILPRYKLPRYTSYIVIDNNYSPKDSSVYSDNIKRRSYYTTGYDALKITAAHELHHAIQYAYGFIEPSVPSIYELTSSWMEYRLYPDVKDYYQYLPQLFNGLKRYPFSSIDADNGYRWSIFGQYMYNKFDDWLMKRMWELIGDGNDPFKALDSAYNEKNTSLVEQWCNFKKWMYFTGSRHKSDIYFNDAKDFPEIKFHSEIIFSPPIAVDTGSVLPFEIRAFRTIFKGSGEKSADTFDLLISNIDIESMRKHRKVSSFYELKIASNFFEDAIPIQNTDYFFKLNYNDSLFCNYHQDLYSYPGISTCIVDNPYPNPINFKLDRELNLPVPSQILLYDNVELNIFNNLLERIYSKNHEVIYHNGCRVVQFLDLEQLSSGIYIYHISHQKANYWGKFILKK